MSSILNATTTTGLAISPDNSGSLQLATNNGTTAVTIDTSQNATFAGSVLGTASTFEVGVNSSGKDTRFGVLSGGNGRVEFYSAGSERMRIDSSGNLLVGRTSTGNTAYGTFINQTGQLNLVVKTGNTQGIFLNRQDDTGNAITFRQANSDVGSISVTGSATAYNTSSDYRLKENIAPMTGALSLVQQLKPVTYNWKSNGTSGQGFIAHELQAVVPDCVTGEKDAVETYTDEDGNEQTRIKPQGVDTSFLVATLTAAIQELKAELDATKAEVQALKGVA